MNLNTLFVKSVGTRAQIINYQTIRWRRPKKPFWLGIAKSKKFIIPETDPALVRTKEEAEIMLPITCHYNTHMKSLLHFISNDNPYLKELYDGTAQGSEVFQSEVSESMERNESFNEESSRRREERMKKEAEENTREAIELMEKMEEEKLKEMEFIEEIVRKEKVLSQSYITPENVDEAIEACLNNVESHDFAIDLNGNIYPGKEPLQSEIQESKIQAESSSS